MRRRRCDKHNILSEGRCPECHIEYLEREIEKYKAALALWGDPVRVHVSYRWRDMLSKIMRAFTCPGATWNSPAVTIGKGATKDDKYAMPRAVAERLAEAAKDADAEYTAAMKDGYESGVKLVARIVSETLTGELTYRLTAALQNATAEFSKEQPHSLSRALERAVRDGMSEEQPPLDAVSEADSMGINRYHGSGN